MRINYDNETVKTLISDLDNIVSSKNLLQKKIGQLLTKNVKKRKNEIEASSNFAAYLLMGLGKPHKLEGNLSNCYAINLTGNFRLIVKPESEDLSQESLKKCESVIIKGVVDYHGNTENWIVP